MGAMVAARCCWPAPDFGELIDMNDEAIAHDAAIHDVLDSPWVGSGLIGAVALISRLTDSNGASCTHMQTSAFGPLKSQLRSIPRRTVFVSNIPKAGAHDRQLSGGPTQLQAEVVRGIRQCAQSGSTALIYQRSKADIRRIWLEC